MEECLISCFEGDVLPLAGKVAFQGLVEKCCKVQIPKLIRWQFKLEPDQVLKVGIKNSTAGSTWQFFYAKMKKDGRIQIPKLTISMWKRDDPKGLEGCIMEITLEPA